MEGILSDFTTCAKDHLLSYILQRCNDGRNFTAEEQHLIKSVSTDLIDIIQQNGAAILTAIALSKESAEILRVFRNTGLLQYLMPELLDGVGCTQNKHHIYDVFEHNIRALQHASNKGQTLIVRIAALLHDIGKPGTKKGNGGDCTFYNHDVIGSEMSEKILLRLGFADNFVHYVSLLVRYHMFQYHPDESSESCVRRLIARVGETGIFQLIELRKADRVGSGIDNENPYKLKHMEFVARKLLLPPMTPKILKITPDDLMMRHRIKQDRRLGNILQIMTDRVLEDHSYNTKDILGEAADSLNRLSDVQLEELALAAKKRISERQEARLEKIKKEIGIY